MADANMKHQYADAEPDADFMATCPPPVQPQELQLAEMMSALGASTVRAVIFDLDTKLCHESWQINEYGETSSDSNDGGAITQFVTAMGTIAQLSQTSANETLIRQLNPRRCAFAWRIDERRVAVVEARYLLPQTGRRDQDAAVLRELFNVRMPRHASDETVATLGVVTEFPHGRDGHDTALHSSPDAGPSAPPEQGLDTPSPRGAAMSPPPLGLGRGLLALIVFCLVAAIVFLVAERQMQSLQGEQLRLRTQAEATMTRQMADVLAQGDYGEVQAELETFAELAYFQDAVVTNAQRRVIAMVGTVQDARIGNIVPSDASSTGTVAVLRGRDEAGVGQLITWGLPGANVGPPTSQRSLLVAAALLSLAALVYAAWLLLRFRRRKASWPDTPLRRRRNENS